jgi:putative DNA primase/helicase
MAASPAAVVQQMLQAGMPPISPHELRIGEGRIIRYGPKKRAWYRIEEIHQRRRDGSACTFYVGAYGSWGHIESTRLTIDRDELDAQARARLREQAAAAQAREDEQRRRLALRAARSAAGTWQVSRPLSRRVGYLARKGVDPIPPSLRLLDDEVIVVPLLRYDSPRERALVGVQLISADGGKRFPFGTAKAGACCRLGPAPESGGALLLCEGIATGLSIAHALECSRPVFCAFDAGNLVDAAEVLRTVYPDAPIGICADDDYLTPGNPGVTYARRAARAVGNAAIKRPLFGDRQGRKLTDFNDLHQLEGLAAVAEQVVGFLQHVEGLHGRG